MRPHFELAKSHAGVAPELANHGDPPLSVPLPPGSSLGRYRILRPLGSGAMGDVYVAEDPSIDRQLAIKTVRLQGASQHEIDERRLRLLREAKAAGRLMHPHAVALFDAGEQDGLVYLAFEFVDGETLSDRMLSDRPIDTLEALRLSREIASALAAAHSQGVIHRDIKPANILLTREGIAKVADFGIAKMSAQSTELTTAGTVIGSPQYMSPEQIRGEELDGRSDQFSLGTVLYELLTRRRAFMGDTITTLVYLILNEEPDPIEEVRPDLNPRVTTLVRRMMDKDREGRYETMQAVVDEISQLEELLGQGGTLPPPPPGLDTAATIATGASAPSEETVVSSNSAGLQPGSTPPTGPATSAATDNRFAKQPATSSSRTLIIAAIAVMLLAAVALPIGGFVLWRTFQNRAGQADQTIARSETQQTETASTPTAGPGDAQPQQAGARRDEASTTGAAADESLQQGGASQEQSDSTPAIELSTARSTAGRRGAASIETQADSDPEPAAATRASEPPKTSTRSTEPAVQTQLEPEAAAPRSSSQRTAALPARDPGPVVAREPTPDEPDQQRQVASAVEPQPQAPAEPDWGNLKIDDTIVGGSQLFLDVQPKSVAKEAFLQVRGQGDRRFTHAGRFWDYRETGYSMPGEGRHLVRLRADGYRDWIVEVDVRPDRAATRLSVTLKR